MLRHAVNTFTKTSPLFVLLTAVCLTLLVAGSDFGSIVDAQDTSSNIQTLLERLIENEVTVHFKFRTPIVADEVYWSIPDGLDSDEDQITRFFAEVGEDYVCFDERAGQAYSVVCTPFSNIISISYLNMPE